MKNDARRLKRARLIERVRTVEQRQAALAASEAEALRIRLDGVSRRTQILAHHYGLQEGAITGAELRRGATMSRQLRELSSIAARQAADAEQRSDASLVGLAEAERRRHRAEEDRRLLAREIVRRLGED